MTIRTIEESLSLIEPYLDFIAKDRDLMREIYPNGMDRNSMIEFILAQKPYKSYAYYKLIKTILKAPYRKIIIIIDKQLLRASLGLFRSIILGTLSRLKLVRIFVYNKNDSALNIKVLKSRSYCK